MSAPAEAKMVLIIVRQADDVELARALIEALGEERPCYLLFTHDELRDRFGDGRVRQGVDSLLCVLNPQHFSLVVSFWGEREPSPSSNLLLLSFFNEVGLPTLEIQHGWLQAMELDPVGLVGDAAAFGGAALARGYAAHSILRWEGDDGIGYLKSELRREQAPFARDDLILVSSQLESQLYGEKQRYQFAIAVLKLAAERPEFQFVWPARPAELNHAEAKLALGMIEEHALPNLTVDRSEPVEAWIGRCRLGISTLCTALLEYELGGKPALVHFGADLDVARTRFARHGFRNYEDLSRAFRRALEAPREFAIETGVPRLNRERLREKIAQAERAGSLAAGWLPIALRYVAYMREGRSARIEIGKVASAVAGLERKLLGVEGQLGSLEKSVGAVDVAVAGVAKELPSLRSRLSNIGERVSVLQRSTLGYKARKFVAQWSGKRGGEPHGD